MGRLIDADALKQELRKHQIESLIAHTEGKNVFDIIGEQPTAYDVDAVVEQLKEKAYTTTDTVCGGLFEGIRLSSAIDIVRKGGKE